MWSTRLILGSTANPGSICRALAMDHSEQVALWGVRQSIFLQGQHERRPYLARERRLALIKTRDRKSIAFPAQEVHSSGFCTIQEALVLDVVTLLRLKYIYRFAKNISFVSSLRFI
ncbi:unnamed protein product [Nezara viridula]|uniref:Uncharacterized protein n=1 Tax=Nezara viridula TaxID=85310 RepID=A0A9P0HL52_NEZVI|nr:unnamed protein product [Nezara viridula]